MIALLESRKIPFTVRPAGTASMSTRARARCRRGPRNIKVVEREDARRVGAGQGLTATSHGRRLRATGSPVALSLSLYAVRDGRRTETATPEPL